MARSRSLFVLVAAAVAVVAVIGLRDRMPDPREFVPALARADVGWIALAVLTQSASMTIFALQQRRLLADLGTRLPLRKVLAIILSRAALSVSMPAGAAVATGYAIREYQRAGVPRRIGAATAIVSGLASLGGLTLLYLAVGAGMVARDPSRPLVMVGGLAALTAAAVVVGRRRPADASGRPATGYRQRLLASAREAWQAGAALRVRDWAACLGYSAVNWLTDLLCLTASTRALGLHVGLPTLAGIFLGVQLVRQVPLTPGGVGVTETALVAGLTAAGGAAMGAAAAVLVYRLISCWLIIPVGGLAALTLRRPAAVRTSALV